MSIRAEKSGLALEAQQKVQEKYDPIVAGQLLQWVASLTGESLDTSGQMETFVETLKDGTVLCNLANALEPGAVRKVNKTAMAFKQMENISFFLAFAEKHIAKTDLFQTVDLYEGQNPHAVVLCLASIARKAEKLFGKPGIGPKEAVGEKREWTAEQLRAGEGMIGLQMGSNKGANAAGINLGNTRHM